VNSIETYT